MNLIQLLSDQRAYEGITHSRWGASWNWWWRRVGDDEDWRFPSPEPERAPDLASRWRTWGGGGSVSWNAMKLPLLFFSKKQEFIVLELGLRSAGPPGGTIHLGVSGGGRALVGCAHPGAPLRWILALEILNYCIKNPHKVSFHSENFYFWTKTTPW